jgi:5-bromo-4-chloroindolyl phosphate hydrolysis protein
MPQLDVTSFTTQIFWLILFLFGFYYIVLTDILPRIAKILKIRLTYKFSDSKDKLIITERTKKKYVGKKIRSIIETRSNKLIELNKNLNRSKQSELAFYAENFIDLNNSIVVQLESNYIKKALLEKKNEINN